jgi:hypothetical protein
MFSHRFSRAAGIAVMASVFLACSLPSFAPTGTGGKALAAEQYAVVMSGRFSGVGVTAFVDRNVVHSWLPEGLQPAEHCPYEKHPVIILFGIQRDLVRTKRWSYELMYTRNGKYFFETFVAVPYLKLRDHPNREPVFHFARVYLNNTKATRQGIRGFGWRKVLTTISVGQRRYKVFLDSEEPVLEAEPGYNRLEEVEANNESLVQIQQMLSQPLVLKHQGVFDVYSFDMHFESATVKSLPSRVQLREGFMPNLAAMNESFAGINEQRFGAFHIDCRFTKAPLDATE